MATVKPFRAHRYDLKKVDLPPAALVCPPYDVIDAKMQQDLYDKTPYNVVRVEYGKQNEGDVPGNDRYSRASATLASWIRDGVMKREGVPAFYLYEQSFDIASGGASRSRVLVRRGIFGAVKLEPFGTGCVFPHEETFGGPKADRLHLMRACSANLSPVFGLIPDEAETLSKLLVQGVTMKDPSFQITEDNGVTNKLWVMDDAKWCAAVGEALQQKNIYIADGHHRYETCCNYRDERRNADNDPTGKLDHDYNYTLMMCVPMSDPGLYILPTHRLIQEAPGIAEDSFLKEASTFFDIRDCSEKEFFAVAEEESGPVKFGVIFKDGSKKLLAIKPNAGDAMNKAAGHKSEAWRALDVSVLQELVLKGLLRLSEEKVLKKEGVSYTPDTKQAVAKVTAKDGHYLMGFILRPTLIGQVVAMNGEKMPQKSTYFYPKLLTGLVIRKI